MSVSNQYTAIPPTSDSVYWKVTGQSAVSRSRTFAPRDPELHYRLKVEAWDKIQAKRPRKKIGFQKTG